MLIVSLMHNLHNEEREKHFLRNLKAIVKKSKMPENFLTLQEASAEAKRRFGYGTSRYFDFMESWFGLARRMPFVAQKYSEQFGRRRKRGAKNGQLKSTE